LSFSMTGSGFVDGGTSVTLSNGRGSGSSILLAGSTFLSGNLNITGGGSSSTENIAVATASGTSNSLPFTVYSVAGAPQYLGTAHGGSGGTPYSLDCPTAAVATGLNVRGGSSMDAIQVICQTVTGTSRTFGVATPTGTAGGTGGSPSTLA